MARNVELSRKTAETDIWLKLGIDCSEYKDGSRKLIFTDESNRIRFFLVKPADVPTYVAVSYTHL